eukprot:360736-Chlamydomonas_euryale.AAC.1
MPPPRSAGPSSAGPPAQTPCAATLAPPPPPHLPSSRSALPVTRAAEPTADAARATHALRARVGCHGARPGLLPAPAAPSASAAVSGCERGGGHVEQQRLPRRRVLGQRPAPSDFGRQHSARRRAATVRARVEHQAQRRELSAVPFEQLGRKIREGGGRFGRGGGKFGGGWCEPPAAPVEQLQGKARVRGGAD